MPFGILWMWMGWWIYVEVVETLQHYCCNQTCLTFLHWEVVGTQKPSFHLPPCPLCPCTLTPHTPCVLAPLIPSWWGHSDLMGRRAQGCKGKRAISSSESFTRWLIGHEGVRVWGYECTRVQGCEGKTGKWVNRWKGASPCALLPSHPFTLLPLCPFAFLPSHPCTLLPLHLPVLLPLHPLIPLPLHLPTLVPFHPPALAPSHPLTLTPSCPCGLSLSHFLALTPSCPCALLPSWPPTLSPSYCLVLPPSHPPTALSSHPLTLLPSCPLALSPSHPPVLLPSHPHALLPSCPTIYLVKLSLSNILQSLCCIIREGCPLALAFNDGQKSHGGGLSNLLVCIINYTRSFVSIISITIRLHNKTDKHMNLFRKEDQYNPQLSGL